MVVKKTDLMTRFAHFVHWYGMGGGGGMPCGDALVEMPCYLPRAFFHLSGPKDQ